MRSIETQYSPEDYSIEEGVIKAPEREDFEELCKGMLTSLMNFYVKFGTTTNNTKETQDIAKSMAYLASRLYEDTPKILYVKPSSNTEAFINEDLTKVTQIQEKCSGVEIPVHEESSSASATREIVV